MEYTKNYKLPQWVETDRILMEDFNRMCANIDADISAAIAANAKALADYQTANDAALAKKAENSAVTALETAMDSADMVLQNSIAAAEAHIAAVEETVKFIKLGARTTTATKEIVTFDLTGIDLSQYVALVIIAGISGSASSTSIYTQVNGKDVVSLATLMGNSLSAMVWYLNCSVGTMVCANGFSSASYAGMSSGAISTGGSSGVAWTALENVGINKAPVAGSVCTLYGIKV